MDEPSQRTILPPVRLTGRITGTLGPLLTARIPLTALGADVHIATNEGHKIQGIVTALREDQITIAPLAGTNGISSGAKVTSSGKPLRLSLPEHPGALVIDSLGHNLHPSSPDNTIAPRTTTIPLNRNSPSPLSRTPIFQQFITGISAIDGFSPIGYGQRLALCAPAGCGKSTLLTTIIHHSAAQHVVVALIGERGREVREFTEAATLGGSLKKCTIVVATSDEPPIKRVLAAESALAISEELRSQGKRVLLIVDSLTRLARSMRDIGLANGELPVRQGYPASVLVALPKLLERAGTDKNGSITALFSLLQEDRSGSDFLTQEVSSLLDGHIVLSPALAQQGHYPAIDVTCSLSRLSERLLDNELKRARIAILTLIHRIYRDRDLLMLGGTPDDELKCALNHERGINQILRQSTEEKRTGKETRESMVKLYSLLQTR